MQFVLISFFEAFADADAHEMVEYFNGDGPLRIVDVGEVVIFFA